MIERIIEFSIRNRFVVLFTAAALAAWGVYAVLDTPMDAIPDLGENQVIVFTDWAGRSPREIEDQVTYPLSLKLQGLAGVKAVRSSSEFNFSMITIIFEDDVDFYFARQRVTEKLALASTFLPAGVTPYLAPDATALGQIFWYTVEPSPEHPLGPDRLWAINKFFIAPQLNAARGVAEVATVGGAPMEYQIDVRTEALRAFDITLGELYAAVSKSNLAVGGGVIQKNNAEYLVRGVGWLGASAKDGSSPGAQVIRDLENTVVKEVGGTPIFVKDAATVQVGTQFRRSVYEKNGSEVVGGVVMMRYGENPLAVTERIKAKIKALQPGLPEGVRIVPAYDRTRLIHGAIETLTNVMWHEMVIATLAILLVLVHMRSVFVVCITLPLAVLSSFLIMWILRVLGIVDVQANIMSLAGITISIGILVDQAIVMVENATHHLKQRFGDGKVTGDIRDIVLPACRTVGRPIFFSVMIMLLSFIPVFMLSGREGKYFHPLAFTKSFALIGTALVSITVVPALIPSFLRGRLRSEEENPIVRGFINVYKPLLTWALPRRNLVMWFFAVLLILAAGMFPLQAILGQGASETAWKTTYLSVFALVTTLTVAFTRGILWQTLALVSLIGIALWAYTFPKIGVAFMPALDEGATLDMPVTVPRASITQAADDLKHRDGLLRSFPEVESVIGKAGRADTPTDPAPLDMVETFINYRPREFWPKRVLKFPDAAFGTRMALAALEDRGFLARMEHEEDREVLVNDASQKALERFDETMRELALSKYLDFERRLGPSLVRFVVREAVTSIERKHPLRLPQGSTVADVVETIAAGAEREFARPLAEHPALEDVTKLVHEAAEHLASLGAIRDAAEALHVGDAANAGPRIRTLFGASPQSLTDSLFQRMLHVRDDGWRRNVVEVNAALFDYGVGAYQWYAIEELAKGGDAVALYGSERGQETKLFAAAVLQVQRGGQADPKVVQPFADLRAELVPQFRKSVFFWQRQGGPKGDLVDDEMGRVLKVPGWSNIFTQPIINRIEMLSTGVRTDIGVKVFGPDLGTVDRICKEVEAALKPLNGARDVIAAPVMGKGYLQIDINRESAARYGIAVEDIQNEIEVALGGRVVTYTVEKRDRFPVRVRYMRAEREDVESIKRLLVSPGGMSKPPAVATTGSMIALEPKRAEPDMAAATPDDRHPAVPGHTAQRVAPIPLSAVAEVKIVEGPAMIRSENSRLLNYVTLNVRGRDVVGFVEEAKRVVAQRVALPEGVHVEWAGEFEHQVRAAETLRYVFPAVIAVIFVILYLAYRDLADAGLMMLAVPEALAGGVFFMYFFPKIANGWDTPPLEFSVAVWVGFIACFGMATETGIIMLVYLREAIEKRGGLENIKSLEELREAVIEGAVHRLRPKLLTEGVAILAIFPMIFTKGVGGEILAPMALPVLGGLLISDEVVDLFLPVRFYWIRRARWLKLHGGKRPDVHAVEASNE
jgi:Cu(I)/Ag(I) efflux system membrane protein CusA/SilA